MSKLAEKLVDVAIEEIGTREVGISNCGPRVDLYKAATNLPPHESWAWCAAFVDWCVREAAVRAGVQFSRTFMRPTTAGAWALEAWSLKQDNSTWTKRKPGRDIKPGDIIVFTFSHCGIAVSEPDDTGHFETVEGNTSVGDAGSQRDGGGVHRRTRRTTQVRSRIRFRV